MSDASLHMGKLVREGWTEVASHRTVNTLRATGFPVQFVQVHAFECRYYTRPWVMRLYVALPGTNPFLVVVGDAIKRGLSPEALEAADRLNGTDGVVALAQGFLA